MKKLDRKLIITPYEIHGKSGILSVLYEDDRAMELHFEPDQDQNRIGAVYIGKVKNIVPNIQAAFVEIAPGVPCYYSMEDHKHPCFVTRTSADKPLCAGDELLVEVSHDAVKTKAPTVTSNISFQGRYAVLTSGNTRIGVSGKLPKEKRDELRKLARQYVSDDYGLIIRTAAGNASQEEVIQDIRQLQQQYEDLLHRARHRTCYSVLRQARPAWLTRVENFSAQGRCELVTDSREIYEQLQDNPDTVLKLYDDAAYPLCKLYSLETELERALQERVWLDSGAYLVIQHTEALTVIDVNTGKISGKKAVQETFWRVNQEAAREIARQLRLRNLSGIILVDFIDLKAKELQQQLMELLRRELKKDPVRADVIDMTALQLVELTRKKTEKPLREQI